MSSLINVNRDNLEKLDKRLLQMIDTYSTIGEKIDRYNYQFVRNSVENIRKGALEPRYIKKALQTFLYLTSCDTKTKGILERMLLGNVQTMISGICTSSRLQYLYFATKEFEVDCADCLHIYPLLDALSVKDFKLLGRYLETLPGPAKHGHRLSRLLCNSVYSVLKMDAKAMDISVDAIYKFNEKGTFDGAMLDAVLGIIENSSERLEEAIRTMLKNNKKKYKSNEVMQYICIPAHALVNLAEHARGESLTNFLPKLDSPYWDEEFHQTVKTVAKERIEDFCDLRGINPVLHNWMEILPVRFNLEDCVLL